MSYMNQTEFASAAGIQELSLDEVDSVFGGAPPLIGAGIAIRAGIGGLAGGTLAYNKAMSDGKMTKAEVKEIGAAVVIGAAAGAATGALRLLGI
jgi:hypothetical protein